MCVPSVYASAGTWLTLKQRHKDMRAALLDVSQGIIDMIAYLAAWRCVRHIINKVSGIYLAPASQKGAYRLKEGRFAAPLRRDSASLS